jgi:hypothetical protein
MPPRCEDPEGPVALWSAPGAVAAGAEVVVEVPHGTRLEIMEQAEQYGVPYYEVRIRRGDGLAAGQL